MDRAVGEGAPVAAEKHYVVAQHHPAASDDNPGSPTAPFQSLRKAADVARPGDVVLVRHGRYHETSPTTTWAVAALTPLRSGTASQPIRFLAWPGEQVVVTGQEGLPVLGHNQRNYIHWEGFITDRPIAIFDSKGGEVGYCEIIGQRVATRDNHDGIRVERCTDTRIHHCDIHGVQGDSWNSAGIKIYSQGRRRVLVEDNHIHHNTTGVFDKHHGLDNIFRRNLLTNNELCFQGNNQGEPATFTIRDNVIDGNVELLIRNSASKIHNNLFRTDRVTGTWVREPDTIANLEFWNNIVVAQGTILVYTQGSPRSGREIALLNHNLYTGTPTYQFGQSSLGLAQMRQLGFETESRLVSADNQLFGPDGKVAPQWNAFGRYHDPPGPEDLSQILNTSRYGPAARK
jgi:hypothetical protein